MSWFIAGMATMYAIEVVTAVWIQRRSAPTHRLSVDHVAFDEAVREFVRTGTVDPSVKARLARRWP